MAVIQPPVAASILLSISHYPLSGPHNLSTTYQFLRNLALEVFYYVETLVFLGANPHNHF